MHIDPLLSDSAVLSELGQRLSALRLSRNLTQAEVAEQAGITRQTLVRIEKGEPTDFTTVIRILRALNLMDKLEGLIPIQSVSPVDRTLSAKHARQRARKSKSITSIERSWKWGDEK